MNVNRNADKIIHLEIQRLVKDKPASRQPLKTITNRQSSTRQQASDVTSQQLSQDVACQQLQLPSAPYSNSNKSSASQSDYKGAGLIGVAQPKFPSPAAVCQQHDFACSLLNLTQDSNGLDHENSSNIQSAQQLPQSALYSIHESYARDDFQSSLSSSSSSDYERNHHAFHRLHKTNSSSRHKDSSNDKKLVTRNPSHTSDSPTVGKLIMFINLK